MLDYVVVENIATLSAEPIAILVAILLTTHRMKVRSRGMTSLKLLWKVTSIRMMISATQLRPKHDVSSLDCRTVLEHI